MGKIKKGFAFLKNHWYFPIVILVLILAAFFYPKAAKKIDDFLISRENRYKKELEIINESEKFEKDRKIKLEEETRIQIDELEKERLEQIREIELSDQDNKEEMVEELKDNREEFLKELAKKYGFDYEP